MGVYWIHPDVCPSVCPSVRPSVDKVSGSFEKTIGSIHFIPSIYTYGVSCLTPIHFRVPSLILALWWPNIWPKIGFPELFWKKILAQFISYLTFTLMGWFSWPLYIFVFLASFSALWWLNIWPKMGFPEHFEKTIGPINFIPGIYLYGVSLLTPIHFRVPSFISVLWWPNIWPTAK